MIKICLAGATGWAGSALAKSIFCSDHMKIVSAVARTSAGNDLGEVLGVGTKGVTISSSANDALQTPCDVFFEYTKPAVAKANIIKALELGAHVVVGTSGLTDQDYSEIHDIAVSSKKGVLAVGNFALTVVLLQKFSEMAAKYIPHWEIIDYAHADKIDAPSGTTRELAFRLGKVRESKIAVSLENLKGEKESRGVRLNGSQIHSVRLPGFVIGAETIFGMPDQKLVMRHEAGSSAVPYVDGALLAIEKVSGFIGLKRGLDTVMDFD